MSDKKTKPHYHLSGTKTGKQSKQKVKKIKRIINTYRSEQHHGIKRTNLS